MLKFHLDPLFSGLCSLIHNPKLFYWVINLIFPFHVDLEGRFEFQASEALLTKPNSLVLIVV